MNECVNGIPPGNAFPGEVQSAGLLSENLCAENYGSVQNTFQAAGIVLIFGNC